MVYRGRAHGGRNLWDTDTITFWRQRAWTAPFQSLIIHSQTSARRWSTFIDGARTLRNPDLVVARIQRGVA